LANDTRFGTPRRSFQTERVPDVRWPGLPLAALRYFFVWGRFTPRTRAHACEGRV
jgi:hypothetical protein